MQIDTHRTNGTLTVRLTGDWTLVSPIPAFEEVISSEQAVSSEQEPLHAVDFDVGHLDAWDSSLVTFLYEGAAFCERHDLDFRADALPDPLQRLVALSRAVPEQETGDEDEEPGWITRLGARTQALTDDVLDFMAFVGDVVQRTGGLLVGRSRLRWRDFGIVVQSTTANALPIVTLISFLVGLILSFLGAVVLQRFGADYYVSYLVSYGMLRELGALMTAIIMAGRTGAAFAAELGSMKIAEEIDALKTLGLSPVDMLALPRIMGIVIAMPLLTVYANFIGILGGLLVATAMLDISTVQFFTGLLTPVTLADGLLGIFKGLVYGGIVGVAGCWRGLETGNDASAVGDATTSAVVTGIILIVLANAIIDWAAAVLQI